MVNDHEFLVVAEPSQAAHAVLAARAQWITNEKTLLSQADLGEVDRLIERADPDSLVASVDAAHELCEQAVLAAENGLSRAPDNA